VTTQAQEQVETPLDVQRAQPTSEGLDLFELLATLEPAPRRDDPPTRHQEDKAEPNSDAANPLLAWLDQMN